MQATKTFEYCAREAAQIFGGASYVRGGKGEKVERLYREVCAPGCFDPYVPPVNVRWGLGLVERPGAERKSRSRERRLFPKLT